MIDLGSLQALRAGLLQAPEVTRELMLDGMAEATMLLEREVKDAFPAVSGLSRGSITSDAFSTPAGVLGVVGSGAVAVAVVELGSRPHRPPIEPLMAWVQDKLGVAGPEARAVAYKVAAKIAREGTKPQRPFALTWGRQQAQVAQIFTRVAQQVVAYLQGAAGGKSGGAA